MEDRRRILLEKQPFQYKQLKDGKFQIQYNGRLIKTIHGSSAIKFQKIIESADLFQIQLFLAKETGQFKHGNERR